MVEADVNPIPDGGVLRELRGGLAIIRRVKHEWRDELDTMTAEKLELRTGKKWGSKFFRDWTSQLLTEWISVQISAARWRRQPEPFRPLDVRLAQPVGLADGKKVHINQDRL